MKTIITMKTIKGDLVKLAAEGHFNVVIHGCNCWNSMGAGIALQLAKRFPQVRTVDELTNPGDPKKLGNASIAAVRGDYDDAILVVNAYTQFNTATKPGECVVDYDAIYKVFNTVVYNIACMSKDIRIGIPMIGAGLAGGNWSLIKLIIEEALSGFYHPNLITLVEYDG